MGCRMLTRRKPDLLDIIAEHWRNERCGRLDRGGLGYICGIAASLPGFSWRVGMTTYTHHSELSMPSTFLGYSRGDMVLLDGVRDTADRRSTPLRWGRGGGHTPDVTHLQTAMLMATLMPQDPFSVVSRQGAWPSSEVRSSGGWAHWHIRLIPVPQALSQGLPLGVALTAVAASRGGWDRC